MQWTEPDHPVKVEFTGSWDLRQLRPHFFPRAAAVIFGRRRSLAIGQQGNNAVPLPRKTEIWTGKIPNPERFTAPLDVREGDRGRCHVVGCVRA
ncbi:hypothetical protein GCM10010207_34420 [Streptomyces atratus]|nr:hypothetical protein GCM10010207_34420 [Streptomyces atratus]